jgi:hypothetical protein
MKIESIKNNGIIANLKLMGLLDDDLKCTELVNKWRMDDTYPEACKEIMNKVYPLDLLDLGHDGNTDKMLINKWFMARGIGASFAGKLTAMYMMLAKADPTQGQVKNSDSKPKIQKPATQNKTYVVSPKPEKKDESIPLSNKGQDSMQLPSINMNIQIHITADVTAQQIDQIFASMSKHLYGR